MINEKEINTLTDLFESFINEFDNNFKEKEIVPYFFKHLWKENLIKLDIKDHMKAYAPNNMLSELLDHEKSNHFLNTLMPELKIEVFRLFRTWLKRNDELSTWDIMKELYNEKIDISFNSCIDCDEILYLEFHFDSQMIRIREEFIKSTKACLFNEDDTLDVIVDIDVPSGKLFFANDIRNVFSKEEEDEINSKNKSSLEGFMGIKSESEAYGSHGMFFGYVGNRSTQIIKDKDNNLFVSDPYDYAEINNLDDYFEFKESDDFDYLGDICTDLWWFCAMDYDLFQKKSKENGFNYDYDFTIVDVQPGKYRMTVYTESRTKNQHLASFEKIS